MRGHGNKTFQYETDDQGDPVVHRVDGSESESALLFSYRLVGLGNVIRDLGQGFDYRKSILFVVVDHSTAFLWDHVAGVAQQWKKNGGIALVPSNFSIATAAHELGHAFGLAARFPRQRLHDVVWPGAGSVVHVQCRVPGCTSQLQSGCPH